MPHSDAPPNSGDRLSSIEPEDLSMKTVKRLLVETRAALDVLTEMVCLLYADGDENEYHETIRALKQRQKQSEERVFEDAAA